MTLSGFGIPMRYQNKHQLYIEYPELIHHKFTINYQIPKVKPIKNRSSVLAKPNKNCRNSKTVEAKKLTQKLQFQNV
jgi:hypothetical protein